MREIIDEIRRSLDGFAGQLDGMSDDEVMAPSGLVGWNRSQVVVHVARAAEAYQWLVTLAATGSEPGPRADGATLARAVAEGTELGAGAVAADLRCSVGGLVDLAETVPVERWELLVTALGGYRHPAWFTLYRCWRELEHHRVDLAAGYTPADWPAAYVTWALDTTAPGLAARDFPVARIEATDLGREWQLSAAAEDLVVTGPGHALLGWLSGRVTGTGAEPCAGLVVTGGAAGVTPPTAPPWPLPPTPAWG
ncbi:maleylpyruvate isomerase family mycothiol-dependent enzyme [Streptacidiphilus fuscans]|uniref:Maleylpyruvate isomerase family mycothiol-dependent enzyme n=1 Tax=Streptacidiphilus fuscans TaxID=2789292 RepID=A0A931B804_9ACTN|nr:maleylpyruvate isomerase family mycothiol-dependent enzyme [Streptacidiphilus fuscans]MBF9070711.1 maleylpyruvate isomerase family mycothiol-dependent enzyme [Streptacidiphilus fuscans]